MLLSEGQMSDYKGAAESFKFATADGRTWMHGPEQVRFRDRGHIGIFRWSDFRLEVDDD